MKSNKLYTNINEFKNDEINESIKKESFILLQGDDIIENFTDKTKALEAFNKYPKIAERPSLIVSLYKLIKETKTH